VKLELHTAGLGTSLDLKIPVQVSNEDTGSETLLPLRRDSSSPLLADSAAAAADDDAELEAEDAEDFFRARTLRAPSEGFVGARGRGGSQAPIGEAPPGYSAMAPTRSMQRSVGGFAARQMSA
ncbi:hypothetical protein LTR53_017368, partial [Teratosphaeriaceae sp. CCFEE 6253]